MLFGRKYSEILVRAYFFASTSFIGKHFLCKKTSMEIQITQGIYTLSAHTEGVEENLPDIDEAVDAALDLLAFFYGTEAVSDRAKRWS